MQVAQDHIMPVTVAVLAAGLVVLAWWKFKWLCWHWLMHPLETLVIRLTWPRYNVDKNGWNPRRITPGRARAQRLERDRVRAIWGGRITR